MMGSDIDDRPRARPGNALKAAYRREKEHPGMYLVPPSEFCEAKLSTRTSDISLMARRVLLMMLQHAAATGRGAETGLRFTMRLADLRPSTHYHDNKRTKEALEELKGIVLLVPCLSERGRPAISLENIFRSGIKYETAETTDALVSWEWDEGMRRSLENSRFFAVLERSMVALIEGQYALALYMLGASLVGRTRVNVPTWEGTIDELRAVLGVPKGKLKDWKDFRKRVLEPAVLEVTQLAPFMVIAEPIMQAGAYKRIKLEFVAKDYATHLEHRQQLLPLTQAERRERREADVKGMIATLRAGVETALQELLNAPKKLGPRPPRQKANKTRDPQAVAELAEIAKRREEQLALEFNKKIAAKMRA